MLKNSKKKFKKLKTKITKRKFIKTNFINMFNQLYIPFKNSFKFYKIKNKKVCNQSQNFTQVQVCIHFLYKLQEWHIIPIFCQK